MIDEPTELIEFLAPYPPEVQELTLEGRLFLKEMLEPVNELFYDATSAVCAGFVFTEKPRDSFVNLAVYSDHVTLIFSWGVHLIDPEFRLQGNGNQVRNIRLKGIETLSDPYVVDLIRQAADNAARPEGPVKQIRTVKIYNGPKRRPAPKRG